MRVLVVSDNDVERLRATTGLRSAAAGEDAPADIIEAATPQEARDRAATGDVDVIVVDGDMHPKGGYSLLYEIRSDAELVGRVSPPALVLAAREQDRFLAAWAGANEFRIKPVDPFEVAVLVRGLKGQPPAPSDPGLDAPQSVKARLGLV